MISTIKASQVLPNFLCFLLISLKTIFDLTFIKFQLRIPIPTFNHAIYNPHLLALIFDWSCLSRSTYQMSIIQLAPRSMVRSLWSGMETLMFRQSRSISIKFVGCSNIFVRYCPELAGGSPTSAPDPYSGEIRFFAYETVITEVPQTLCAPQSWPFEFVFPSKGNILKPKKFATITRLIGDKHCPPPLPIKAYRACPRVPVQLPTRSRHTYQFHQMGNTTFSTPTQAPPK